MSGADAQVRTVLGLYLLGCYMLVVSFLVSEPFEASGRQIEPDPTLAGQIRAVAAVTLVAALALSVRHFGAWAGVKMVLREAWPGLLAGGGLGLITGAPLRALVPVSAFWFVLAPVYLAGVVLIRWAALRAPASIKEKT